MLRYPNSYLMGQSLTTWKKALSGAGYWVVSNPITALCHRTGQFSFPPKSIYFAHTAPEQKGGENIEKILIYSPAEVIQLLKQGYRLDSMGYFQNGSGASYTLVKN